MFYKKNEYFSPVLLEHVFHNLKIFCSIYSESVEMTLNNVNVIFPLPQSNEWKLIL